MPGRPQLFELIAQNASISASDLERAARLQQERGCLLAEVLVWESLLDEDEIFFILSRGLGLPGLPEERLLHLALSPELRRRVSRAFARNHMLVPIDLDPVKGMLSVAMFDPSDVHTLEELREAARVAEIRPYLARRSAIMTALKGAYSDQDDEPPSEQPEWLPAGRAPGTRREPSAEAKVQIDPGLAQEIAALDTGEVLRQIRVPRPQVRRARPDLDLGRAPVRPERPDPDEPPDEPELVGPATLGEDDRTPTDRLGVELRGRSLLHLPADDAGEFVEDRASLDPTNEVDLGAMGVYDEHPGQKTAVREFALHRGASAGGEQGEFALHRGASAGGEQGELPEERTPVPDLDRMEQVDALLRELLSSVGVLVAMLEERIDPAGGTYREYGRISRLVARELGLDELGVSRVALAAHLYGLDIALRRELGITSALDVQAAFSPQPSAPGGLGPSLRMLGAKALGLEDQSGAPPLGVVLIRLVTDYLELRAESDGGEPDVETVAQLLRTGGGDPQMIDALVRALETFETARVRVEPGG